MSKFSFSSFSKKTTLQSVTVTKKFLHKNTDTVLPLQLSSGLVECTLVLQEFHNRCRDAQFPPKQFFETWSLLLNVCSCDRRKDAFNGLASISCSRAVNGHSDKLPYFSNLRCYEYSLGYIRYSDIISNMTWFLGRGDPRPPPSPPVSRPEPEMSLSIKSRTTYIQNSMGVMTSRESPFLHSLSVILLTVITKLVAWTHSYV